MAKKIISAITMLLVMFNVNGQDKTFKNLFQAAQEHMLYEEYEDALNKYKNIESHNWLNPNIAFSIGMCYMNLGNQIESAIPYLEKATTNTSPTYREGNYKETAAPEEAWFYLGKAYRLNGQYSKAIDAYREYKATLDISDLYYQDFIALQIESCSTAERMMNNQISINIEKADFSIDTECYYPAVAGDEKSVAFTSYQKVRDRTTDEYDYFELIYYSTKNDNGTWSKPIDITYDIASDGTFSTSSLSYHGDMMILYRDDFGNGNLYYSTMTNGKWGEIQKFPKNINSKYNETHGSLSKDGKTLYFVSDRPGGQGGKDIFKSTIDSKGNWTNPVALSYIINSSFDEEAAFIAEDDVTLYFVSEGHSTMGGFDIFKSTVDYNGNWSSPQNLGYPISTPYDDVFYAPIGDGSTGYMDRVPEAGGTKVMSRISPIYTPEYNYVAQVEPEPVAEPEPTYIEPVYTPETEPTYTQEPEPAYSEPKPVYTEPEPVYTPSYPSEYQLKGTISLQDNKDINETFYVHVADAEGHVIKSLSPNTVNGVFSTTMTSGNYKITAYGDGYEPTDAFIYISPVEMNPEVLAFISMAPIAVSTGESYSIKSILFDDNSSKLNNDAQMEVERIAVLMQANPELKLEVTGNTDDHGTDEYNQRLSIMRAREVVNYLTRKGISENRLQAKGMGKSNFIAINQNSDGSDNPEGRALNRRVDINITNPTNANITVEGIYVPDELKYRNYLTYTIWITESEKPLSPASFKNINNVWMYENDGKYMYTIGLFKHEGEAIQIVGDIVDAGFTDAKVISSLEYNQLIRKSSNYYKSKMADPDVNTYTIQLMAMNQPVAKSAFRGLFDVEMHKGDDGLYRYTWGEFIGKKSAQQALEDVLAKGFTDAFIVNYDKFK